MEIHFKNVNQGDSIIITWLECNSRKTGIIDCHLENNNPTLQYVMEFVENEIEFIFISHPHYDHYSGIVELLNYCERKSITINKLGFSFDTAITYIYNQFYSTGKKINLFEFFEFLYTQGKKKNDKRTILTTFQIHSKLPSFNNDEFSISFLRPTETQTSNLARSLGKFSAKKTKKEPDLNIYSTVLELVKNKKSILLTSDAPLKSFKSLERYYKSKSNIFYLVQIPHHGSNNNHWLSFWRNLKRTEKCPAVFSVGELIRDRLPNTNVVEEIDSEKYTIHSTNIVHGIADFLKIKHSKKTPSILGMSSKLKSSRKTNVPSQYHGDQVFNIT